MSDQRYAVSVAHGDSVKHYSEQFQTQASYAAPWKAVLQKAHKQATVSCQCPGTGCRLLAVRHMSDSDSFHLSRYPRTGAEHALDCVYYSPDPDKSASAHTAKAWLKKRPRVISRSSSPSRYARKSPQTLDRHPKPPAAARPAAKPQNRL